MLSHWKKWIADRLGHDSPRRRPRAQQFRGQFESLETRNVLTAAIGVVSFDIVAVHVEPESVTVYAVAEVQPTKVIAGDFGSAGKLSTDNRESYGLWQPPPMFFGLPMLRPGNWQLKMPQGRSVTSGFLTSGAGNYGSGGDASYRPDTGTDETGAVDGVPSGETSSSVKATFNGPTGNNPANNDRSLAITNSTRPGGPPDRGYRAEFNFASGGIPQMLADYTASSAQPQSPLSTRNLDVALEELSSDSLLLAVGSEAEREDTLFGDADDELGAKLDSDGQQEESGKHTPTERLAESLDALQRERAAVDAVLAELHEITLIEQKDTTADTPSSDHNESDRAIREYADRFFIADGTTAQAPYDASAGGMVLLAATGDANSSAFELATSIATGAELAGATSFAVEAPLGVYQAIDVGVRPTTTSAAETISNTAPTAKVHTDVSAENAPVKKSEQPSA